MAINLIVTRLTTMNEIFVDSNIILYLMDSNDHKRSIAQNLLLNSPFISAQVLTEVANICKRKFNYDKLPLKDVSHFC